jgi:hypothetical protein
MFTGNQLRPISENHIKLPKILILRDSATETERIDNDGLDVIYRSYSDKLTALDFYEK